jgi:hypothetical protein
MKTLLIVEDEESNFMLLINILKNKNFRMLHAKNGKEAVEVCTSDPSIDLVLMDIKMPVMNGYEATRHIKYQRPNLPVIAQTAYALNGDKEMTLSAGCDDYISKPIKRQELLLLIDKYLKS